MTPLPLCRWREELSPDGHLCRSAKFLHAPNAVGGDFCLSCCYADHAPPPPLPPALPCVHLGERRAGQGRASTRKQTASGQLFECALHGRCAVTEKGAVSSAKVPWCGTCPDYLAREPFGPSSSQMRARADAFLAAVPAYPSGHYQGRGVVIAGGGERYFASLYVTIRALRHVGWQLPIQVWYLGRNDEMPAEKKAMLAPYDVECVDADNVRLRHPARILNGWELKVFATLHSRFEEVLFLDADCYPCRNPEFLFDLDDYRAAGAIFWADCVATDERLKWSAFGVPDPKRLGSVESGQYVLNKRLSWKRLNLAWFYNDHSDFYYHYCYGDKHTFEVAWAHLDQAFVMFTPIGRVEHVGYVHIGPDQRPLFVHRCSDKFRLDTQSYPTSQRNSLPGFYPTLPLEKECWSWLTDLALAVGAPMRSPDGAIRKRVVTPASRIALATFHTPQIADYGAWTSRVLCEYADRHGYRAVTRTWAFDPQRPPSWSKIPLIEWAFAADPACQWLMWLDADALVARLDVPLTEFLDDDADLIVADDSPHGLLNMGVFLIRNCPAAAELLRRAYAKTQFLHHHWWEQPAIVETIREGVPGLRVKIVPRRLFNAFAPEYREGDFVIHFAGQSHAERRREIRRRAVALLHPMPETFRAGTNDKDIFDDVVTHNEYRLPDDMSGMTILDVGAHIGTFAYACAARGAAALWCVEAHPENFAVLERSLAAMTFAGRRVPIFGAAWRGDRLAVPLKIHHGDWVNRGGRCLTQEEGAETTLIAFDSIVQEATGQGRRRIDLLKLDCEGSEFPILFTSRTLSFVDAICAEVHFWAANLPDFHVEGHEINESDLRRCLEAQGFRVNIEAHHLWAWRDSTPCSTCFQPGVT